MTCDELSRAVHRMIRGTARFSPAAWTAPAPGATPGSRAAGPAGDATVCGDGDGAVRRVDGTPSESTVRRADGDGEGAVRRVDGTPSESTVRRADVMHTLVQRIAELAADAEAVDRRPVPRLDNDLALPDQLAVVSTDLTAAAPSTSVLAAADAALRDAHRQLWP